MEILQNLHAFIWRNPAANNCNTFFIDGQKKILVDPGHQHLFGHVKDELSRLSLTTGDIDIVIVTHGHPDHMEGVGLFFDSAALIGIHTAEMDFIRKVAPHYGEALGVSKFEPDILLREGDLHMGNLTFQVIHCPGHSPGSVCLYWSHEKVLITGDVVFNQGVGRTDLPGGNGESLKESIRRIARLDVDYLLPGHGEIVTGAENVQKNFKIIEDFWFDYL